MQMWFASQKVLKETLNQCWFGPLIGFVEKI